MAEIKRVMGNAIAIESSGEFLSFAFLKMGKPAGGFHRNAVLKHEEIFWKEFPRRLARAGLSWKKLDFVAATLGPGRFTGLRFALGLAWTWSRMLRIPFFCPPVSALLKWQGGRARWPNARALLRFALQTQGRYWYQPPEFPLPLYGKDVMIWK